LVLAVIKVAMKTGRVAKKRVGKINLDQDKFVE
jgi:hypothetical protein